jgi:hypothetical protein
MPARGAPDKRILYCRVDVNSMLLPPRHVSHSAEGLSHGVCRTVIPSLYSPYRPLYTLYL